VLSDPAQPQWPGVVGQQPDHATHPTALRQGTDPLRQILINAHVHKGCERVTVRCEQPQRAVPGIGEITGSLHDLAQHGGRLQLVSA
jgi:hypothetical protein